MRPDDINRPACQGMAALFESTHPLDHLDARAICLECPVRDWCEQERITTSTGSGYAQTSLSGTWAGKLYGGTADALRMLREEQAFTTEEARAAHTRWYHGKRDKRTEMGEKVYQRRIARQKRARARADVG